MLLTRHLNSFIIHSRVFLLSPPFVFVFDHMYSTFSPLVLFACVFIFIELAYFNSFMNLNYSFIRSSIETQIELTQKLGYAKFHLKRYPL
jgi:hypothetical protein